MERKERLKKPLIKKIFIMDYLEYNEKKQHQGLGVFHEKDVKLTREDFTFGNLKDEKLNSPQVVLDSPSPQTNKDELIQLFPTPVLVCKYN